MHVHFALSHYPLGYVSPPYAQYLEAGYQRADYGKPGSRFYGMFARYLRQFAALFRDETALSGLTAAGEGDRSCGKTFVNTVHDLMRSRCPNHLFAAEPLGCIRREPNFYRKEGWKPLLGGMRTYRVDGHSAEAPAVAFKLAGLGHVFMAEGLYWGYMRAAAHLGRYRRRVRLTHYTGLALRNPLMMNWEERVVEDERLVFRQVRDAIDWSQGFARARLGIRVGRGLLEGAGRQRLYRYERALAHLPLESVYLWEDEPAPAGTLHVIDARKPFAQPAFVADGGTLPDELEARMPLRLPPGLLASYSWSEDRRTLLALLRPARSPMGTTTEAGNYTYADTSHVLDRDTRIDT
jgi:hypothetical protein